MARTLSIAFAGASGCEVPHLSVDGMSPRGPNLSHWPGNRTPRRFKADLSTGICLLFSRAAPTDQEHFLGDAQAVLNDHYDTDGFLSMLAVTRPELALAHEELCLAGAATGDFGAWHGRSGFAIDRIVANLAAEHSPVRQEFAGLAGPERSLARYRWLIEHAESVLTEPERLADLWESECRDVMTELDQARDGALTRDLFPRLGLSIVRTGKPVRRMTLNTLAGAYRVLHLQATARGTLARFHDRTESWFEVVSFAPPPRTDLRILADRLRELEPANADGHGWHADPPDAPIPELWFGEDSEQEYGQVSRKLIPSSLPPSRIARVVEQWFRDAR